jgi:CheY-like chemotaxis protein
MRHRPGAGGAHAAELPGIIPAAIKQIAKNDAMRRLLIVEDNARMREMIRLFLCDLAEEIIERADGDEALAAYCEFAPDCVVMDIEMARVDGLRATRQILAAFPQAYVVILTQHDDPALRQAAREAGAAAYVTKQNLLPLRQAITT